MWLLVYCIAAATPAVFLAIECSVWLPWSSSSWAVLMCPSEAAVIRAVRPCWSTMFTSTPWFRNNSTTWPKDAGGGRLQLSAAGIVWSCACLPSVSTIPASDPVSRRWKVEWHPACFLAPQLPPDPTTACRQTDSHILLLLSELMETHRVRQGKPDDYFSSVTEHMAL